ncbi:MAG TPA: hypothetical protein VFC52_04655 [Solirubrobacterales bacterium]|nr:hypothetical protein [Solirubrobacterales bacterium]
MIPGLFALAALSAPQGAQAEFSVGPTVGFLSLQPGEAAVGTTRVKLEGESRSRFTVEVEDIAQRTDGGLSYTPPARSRFSASSWIEVSPRSFSARPNRVQPIEYLVRVPEEAEPGDHVTSLTIKRRSPAGRAGVTAIQAISVRLTVRAAGRLSEGVAVESLDRPEVAGKGPISVGAVLRNTGNVRLDFDRLNKGSLAIVDDGEGVARAPLRGVLFPGRTRYVELAWEDPPLLGHPEVEVAVATKRGTVKRAEAFWLVPWRQGAALTLLALAVLVVATGRRRRRLAGAAKTG